MGEPPGLARDELPGVRVCSGPALPGEPIRAHTPGTPRARAAPGSGRAFPKQLPLDCPAQPPVLPRNPQHAGAHVLLEVNYKENLPGAAEQENFS